MDLSFFSQKRGKLLEILLPTDLVLDEILTRLPVKSLMRFKCVSKLWSCHIISRYFINLFLTFPSRPRRIFMCLVDDRTHEYAILSSAPYTSTPSSFVVDYDLTIQLMESNILQKSCGFTWYTYRKKPRIFNPATKQLVTLPAAFIPPPREEGNRVVSYFFGHDPVNDLYKMVCSTGVYFKHLQEIRSEHWVFVLKPEGGSWKKVQDFCPHLPSIQGLCINGVIYYLAWIGTDNYVIMSFHIRSEEFKTIQVPHKKGYMLTQTFKNLSPIIDYGGKLTLFDETTLKFKGMLNLWVLEDATNKLWSRKTLILKPSRLHLFNNITFKVKYTTQNRKRFLISEDMRKIKIEIKGLPNYWFSKDTIHFDLMFMDQSESIMNLET